MHSSRSAYKRLPGTGYRALVPLWAMVLLFFAISIFVLLLRGRRIQLWQGKDHLLVVGWTGAREYYKRIHYGDIQWMSIHRTDEHLVLSCVLSILAVIFLGVAGFASEMGVRITFGVLGATLLGLLAANLAVGPTCKAYIGTAVQVEELVSLKRIRRARKVFDMLRPSVVAAQSAVESGSGTAIGEGGGGALGESALPGGGTDGGALGENALP